MNEVYAGMLRMSQSFQEDHQEIRIFYNFDADQTQLLSTYPIEQTAGSGTTFERAERLLQWETDHIFHKGDYMGRKPMTDAFSLFDYAFDQPEEQGINCAMLSTALTQCLLAIGIKARTISLMPLSPYDGDNHVVSEVWCPELNQWIMMDPTYNLYLMDDAGKPLSITEIRRKLAYRETFVFSEHANYNGTSIEYDDVMEYYAKDFYYFQLASIQGSAEIDKTECITIAPVGLDVKEKSLANIDYRIQCWGDSDWIQEWRNGVSNMHYIYKGLDFLD